MSDTKTPWSINRRDLLGASAGGALLAATGGGAMMAAGGKSARAAAGEAHLAPEGRHDRLMAETDPEDRDPGFGRAATQPHRATSVLRLARSR